MAKRNYKKYINIGKTNSCKKYLYFLRAIACYEFIKSENKLPPLPYKEVIGFLPLKIQEFFVECINKKVNSEKAKITPDKEVDEFIRGYIERIVEKKVYDFSKTNELNDYIVKVISSK